MFYVARPYYSVGNRLRAKNLLAASSGSFDFPDWAVGLIDWDKVRSGLDVGCGWGRFARKILTEKYEAVSQLICSDLWPGMVRTCQETVGATPGAHHARYIVGDARRLPLRANVLDLVMANHMLYEFARPSAVIAECARVLAVDGQLMATTYADDLRVPLVEFHEAAVHALVGGLEAESASSFSIRNGEALLAEAFDRVTVNIADEENETDVDSLVNVYVQTGRYRSVMEDDSVADQAKRFLKQEFRRRALHEMQERGSIRSTTRWVCFVATGPRDRAV